MDCVTVLTVGHSTRPLTELLGLLGQHAVTLIADVRTVPRSRRNPQYDRATLPGALGEAGIGYEHLRPLGGLRHPRRDSPNVGWRNPSFRGYADHMATAEFAAGLEQLVAAARTAQVAVMCAEAVPWRCHRQLIADALVALGHEVFHIVGPGAPQPHHVTPFALVEGGRVRYPSASRGASIP